MFKQLLLGSVMTLAAVTGANAGLIIDDFTDLLENDGVDVGGDGIANNEVKDATNNSVGVFDRSVQVLGTIIGGDRELILNKTSGSTGGPSSVAAVIDSGQFTHNNSAGVTGTSLLRWDGSGVGDTNGLDYNLGANLGLSGGFRILVIESDSTTLTTSSMTLSLYTDALNYSTIIINIPEVRVSLGNSPYVFYASLASIAASGMVGNGVTLTNVNAIELLATGAGSFDVAIDIVDIVPEPASLTLLGAGVMGLGAIKRRRKV